MRRVAWVLGLALLGCDDGTDTTTADATTTDATPTDAAPADARVALDRGQSSAEMGLVDAEPADVGVDAGPARPLADWCEALSEATEIRATRCPGDPAGLDSPCFGDALTTLEAAGEVAYDADQASACLRSLAHGACHRLVADCAGVLVGQNGPGEPCALGLECAPGVACAPDPSTCPRTCEARVAADQPCDPFGPPCVADHACISGLCVAHGGPGAACDVAPCGAGLGCSAGACVALGVLGERCDARHCAAGLTCIDDRCAPLGGPDAPCAMDADCALSGGTSQVCAGGRCAALPGAGAPCYEQQCGDARCDVQAIPPTCVAWPVVGEPCLPGNRCGPTGRCVAGTCAARASADEPCTSPADCLTGRCGGGVCRAADAPLCPVE